MSVYLIKVIAEAEKLPYQMKHGLRRHLNFCWNIDCRKLRQKNVYNIGHWKFFLLSNFQGFTSTWTWSACCRTSSRSGSRSSSTPSTPCSRGSKTSPGPGRASGRAQRPEIGRGFSTTTSTAKGSIRTIAGRRGLNFTG